MAYFIFRSDGHLVMIKKVIIALDEVALNAEPKHPNTKSLYIWDEVFRALTLYWCFLDNSVS